MRKIIYTVGIILIASSVSRSQQQYFLEKTSSRLPQTIMVSTDADVADIDHDGDYDILVSASNFYQPRQRCYLFINDGSGFFSWESDQRLPDVIREFGVLEFGLINDDSSYDAYIQCPVERNLIFINDGHGSFIDESQQRSPGSECTEENGFVFADFTGDSRWDIVNICAAATGQCQFFENDGQGYFIDRTAEVMPIDTLVDYQGAAVDYDNDLDLDLFLSSFIMNFGFGLRGLENRGNVFVNFPEGFIPNIGAYRIAAADIDMDGDLDLILTSGAFVGILINYDSLFVDESALRLPALAQEGTVTSTALGDFDNDGDIDIFATLSVFTRNHYFRNDGNGYFTLADEDRPDSLQSYRWAEPFDADGDGDLDIFLACSGTGQQRILINYSTPDTIPPRILAKQLPLGAVDSASHYPIKISAYDNISVEKGALYVQINYRINGGDWQAESFSYCGGTIFSYFIPSQPVGSTVDYYITLRDRMGNMTFAPSTAPESLYSFQVINNAAINGEGDTAPVPIKIKISAYPNPFNSSTTISINDIDDGEIYIFDITGRQVASLHGRKGKAVWDASGYTSGVYFARMKEGDKGQSIKLILLK